jgi:hypothetical protein
MGENSSIVHNRTWPVKTDHKRRSAALQRGGDARAFRPGQERISVHGDLQAAWEYAAANSHEIDSAIKENEEEKPGVAE